MMLIENDHYHKISAPAPDCTGGYLGRVEYSGEPLSSGGGGLAWPAWLVIISSSDGKTFPLCSLMFLSL